MAERTRGRVRDSRRCSRAADRSQAHAPLILRRRAPALAPAWPEALEAGERAGPPRACPGGATERAVGDALRARSDGVGHDLSRAHRDGRVLARRRALCDAGQTAPEGWLTTPCSHSSQARSRLLHGNRLCAEGGSPAGGPAARGAEGPRRHRPAGARVTPLGTRQPVWPLRVRHGEPAAARLRAQCGS